MLEGVTLEIEKPELATLLAKLRASGANLEEVLFERLNASAATPEIGAGGEDDSNPRPNLADFLLNSPFAGAELDLDRRREYPRSDL